MKLHWPDIHFPPVNLYSCPRMAYPHMYLELEREYCKDIAEQFYEARDDTIYKEVLRLEFKDKREEFNRLWNARRLN